MVEDRELAEIVASLIPGTTVVTVPDDLGRRPLAKPPMVPSDLPTLRDFAWTDPRAGLHTLLGEVDRPDAPAPSPRRPGGEVTA